MRNARRAKNPNLDIHEDILKLKLLKGVSHGFLQFDTIYKETDRIYKLLSDWFIEAFEKDEAENRGGLSEKQYLAALKEMDIDSSRYLNPFPGYF